MFSHFFIERPIFASVLSIVITLAGTVAVLNLPVAQYPQITPPSIMVMCNYPGANANDVADSVAAPIEQQINGVEDMLYMVSQSNNDGSYTLTVTFKPGVNLNFAQVLVQNRINLALPLLPDVVKQAGVTTRKRNPDILQVIAVYSPHNRYDQLYLSNFVTIKIRDEVARVDGVGDCQQFGQQDYSMRLWIDPERLAALNMTASDVANALREQNRQVAAGHIGQYSGGSNGQPFEFTLTTVGRLQEPAEFDEIILRTDSDGRKVRLKDIGHAELGAKNLDSTSKVDGLPNGSLAVFALPDANSIATAERVREKMEQLKKGFPEDIDYTISLDMTPFIQESINEVIRTLIEAVVLVALVVLIFLQNWRSAIIPLVAVPVAVVGTFAVMAAIGFSLNNLTLFGLVLAIGIVVDDAIVVVEAVEHHIEEGMSPRRAAHTAMDQVSGPVVAVALVLSAVFVPCAFISGITGQFFRQFALTIAVSTVISAFNSLTLSPALAAILLKPRVKGKFEALPRLAFVLSGALLGYLLAPHWLQLGWERLSGEVFPSALLPWAKWGLAAVGVGVGWLLTRPLNFLLGEFFQLFNWGFRASTAGYTSLVGLLLRGSALVLLLYGGLLGLTWWVSSQLPAGYIPNQDQARFYIAVQLPDAASLERTQTVVDDIRARTQKVPGVEHTTAIGGQSFTLNANGSNFGQFFCSLRSFDTRAELQQETWYKLTRKSLVHLQEDDKVPAAVVAKLDSLSQRELSQEEFETALAKILSTDELEQYQELLLKRAKTKLDFTSTGICDRVRDLLEEKVPGAKVSLFTPPPVSGLGSASGFKIIIEDRGDLGLPELQRQADRLMAAGNAGHFKLTEHSFATLRERPEEVKLPEEVLARLSPLKDKEYLTQDLFDGAVAAALNEADVHNKKERERIQKVVRDAAERIHVVSNLFSVFRAHTPQLMLDINRDQCQSMGVNPSEVFNTLQIYLGSLYVNDFNKFGRTWQVIAQAGGEFRDDPKKVNLLKVRNDKGAMVPLGAVLSIKEVGGPINIGRYNMYPAAAILGQTKPGISTGEGIEEMERLCHEILPQGMTFEWTEINFMQIDAAKNIWNNLIFPLAVVFVFLVLAAQYESWALPLAVILVVPMCILGSLTGVYVTHGDINIFTQIGFVVLVGLASKNAILIVEFAKHKREDGGLPRREATLAACKLRLRPILMTSFAFILGVVPLLVSTGAGSEMRRVLGTAVFSGMLGVTLFGIFLTPVFFYVIEGFIELPFFSSERVREIGKVLLYLLGGLTLGLPWFLVLVLGRRVRGPATVPAVPGPHAETNGVVANGQVMAGNGEGVEQSTHAENLNGAAVPAEHQPPSNGQEKPSRGGPLSAPHLVIPHGITTPNAQQSVSKGQE